MKKIIAGIYFLCFCLVMQAQSTKVAIMDFNITPSMNNGANASADSSGLEISFKINKCDSAFKMHVYFGTQKDIADIKTIEATFVRENGKCFTLYKGIKREIQAYQAFVEIQLSNQQIASFTNAALFVETANGQNTGRLYITK